MKKHILIISQYFYPETFRINDIALEFVKKEYKVTVLTGIPNYPQGKFYNGYGIFQKRREQINGITIIRIPIIPRGKTSLQLFANYYSFVLSGFFWCLLTRMNPDLVFCYEVSPITQALIGKWISKIKKTPLFLYVQDLWPDNLEAIADIHSKIILKHYSKMAQKIYKQCRYILATSESFVQELQNRVDDKKKVIYWPQYAEDYYKPIKKVINNEIPNDKKLKIIFTGNIGEAQGLEILPQLATLLKDRVYLIIVGDGRYKETLLKKIESLKDHFIVLPKQEPEKISELIASCDLGLITIKDNPILEKTIPAKLQSYMACGIPILFIGKGEVKNIIETSKCGYVIDRDHLDEVIKVLDTYEDNRLIMKKNAIEYCKKYFCKENLLDEIIKLIEL